MGDLDNSSTPDDSATAATVTGNDSTTSAATLDGLLGPVQPVEGPILNKDGTERKKRGRKSNAERAKLAQSEPATAPATLSPSAPKTPQEKKAVRLGCDQTARAVLGTVVGAMRELVGPEWDFQSQEEADGMRIAVAAYIEAKGGGEMSPEVALLLVSTGYAAPRLQHQNTRDKLGAFFGGAWKALRGVFSR